MSDLLKLRIEKAVYGGAGLARHDGKAIFTPFTLPGELVTARVTHSKSSFAEASLVQVLDASADRTKAPCPYFGVCGGCHYQHASYAAQLVIKAGILEETLTRAGLAALPSIVAHAGSPLGYRNRIRLHLDAVTSAVGYRERRSNRLLPVTACPIAAPELERALILLGPLCTAQQCGRYFSQLELSANHDGSELLLALWESASARPAESQGRLTQLCEALRLQVPALRGGGVHATPSPSRSGEARHARAGGRGAPVLGKGRVEKSKRDLDGDEHGTLVEEQPGALIATWGTPQMTYQAAGLDYQVSLGAFFQVNRSLVDSLVALATDDRSGQLAWDLYAGVGLFSRVLARHFARVVAVEGAPVSSHDLRMNLGTGHEVVRGSTLDFLQRQARSTPGTGALRLQPQKSSARHSGSASSPPIRTLPDFILVDPPRAGLGGDVTRLLSQLGTAQITYVSCDPATLGRDLRALVDSGYRLQQLHLIDLFPQTFHLEAVAMLSRP